MKEVFLVREIMFHTESDQELHEKQSEVIKSLEVLMMGYSIERTKQYGTGTPTWEITIYK